MDASFPFRNFEVIKMSCDFCQYCLHCGIDTPQLPINRPVMALRLGGIASVSSSHLDCHYLAVARLDLSVPAYLTKFLGRPSLRPQHRSWVSCQLISGSSPGACNDHPSSIVSGKIHEYMARIEREGTKFGADTYKVGQSLGE